MESFFMIKFQDFKKDKKTSGDGEFDCVRKMNEWIENKNIQVVSVETLFSYWRRFLYRHQFYNVQTLV
jgi:hypothetical protein